MAGPSTQLYVPKLQSAIAMVFSNGLFLGIYLVTYCFANRWLLFTDEGWKLRKRFHWLMVIITNILVLMLLADASISLRVYMRQVDLVEAGHPLSEIADSDWHPIASVTLSNATGLLTDIALMYRLWFVYNKNINIIWFPIFLWIGGLICTIMEIWLQVEHSRNPSFGPYHWTGVDMLVGPGVVLIPFWLSTIILNAYCTGLIIWRVQRASKTGVNAGVTRQLQFLIRILMESGVLYLVVGFAHFIVWCSKHSFSIVLFGMINRIVVAIAFNLVLIRTARNKVEGEEPEYGSDVTTSVEFGGKKVSIQVRKQVEVGSHDSSEGVQTPTGFYHRA